MKKLTDGRRTPSNGNTSPDPLGSGELKILNLHKVRTRHMINKTIYSINVREYGYGQSRENGNTQGTQDEDKQNKNTTQYVLDTTICKQTQIT